MRVFEDLYCSMSMLSVFVITFHIENYLWLRGFHLCNMRNNSFNINNIWDEVVSWTLQSFSYYKAIWTGYKYITPSRSFRDYHKAKGPNKIGWCYHIYNHPTIAIRVLVNLLYLQIILEIYLVSYSSILNAFMVILLILRLCCFKMSIINLI